MNTDGERHTKFVAGGILAPVTEAWPGEDAPLPEVNPLFPSRSVWLLIALNKVLPNLYHGTVSYTEKQKRRARGKRQRAGRRACR